MLEERNGYEATLTTHLVASGHCRGVQRRELAGSLEVPFSRVFLRQRNKKMYPIIGTGISRVG